MYYELIEKKINIIKPIWIIMRQSVESYVFMIDNWDKIFPVVYCNIVYYKWENDSKVVLMKFNFHETVIVFNKDFFLE